MPREHQDYRNNIEQLNRLFPARELLNVSDVMSVTGRCRSTVKKYYMPATRTISKAALARLLCNYDGRRDKQ